MPNLTLKNVSKKWKEITAVNNVSLNINDGEFIVLLGPSGCGKTTTMRLIAGLEEITEGEIYIGDEMVNEIDPRKRDVAMVFQNYSLFPHMSVRNNLAYPLKIKKFSKEAQKNKPKFLKTVSPRRFLENDHKRKRKTSSRS